MPLSKVCRLQLIREGCRGSCEVANVTGVKMEAGCRLSFQQDQGKRKLEMRSRSGLREGQAALMVHAFRVHHGICHECPAQPATGAVAQENHLQKAHMMQVRLPALLHEGSQLHSQDMRDRAAAGDMGGKQGSSSQYCSMPTCVWPVFSRARLTACWTLAKYQP